jgi:hypothetical protein
MKRYVTFIVNFIKNNIIFIKKWLYKIIIESSKKFFFNLSLGYVVCLLLHFFFFSEKKKKLGFFLFLLHRILHFSDNFLDGFFLYIFFVISLDFYLSCSRIKSVNFLKSLFFILWILFVYFKQPVNAEYYAIVYPIIVISIFMVWYHAYKKNWHIFLYDCDEKYWMENELSKKNTFENNMILLKLFLYLPKYICLFFFNPFIFIKSNVIETYYIECGLKEEKRIRIMFNLICIVLFLSILLNHLSLNCKEGQLELLEVVRKMSLDQETIKELEKSIDLLKENKIKEENNYNTFVDVALIFSGITLVFYIYYFVIKFNS